MSFLVLPRCVLLAIFLPHPSISIRFICPVYSPRLELFPFLLLQMVYGLSISRLFLSIRFIKPTVLHRLSAVALLGASIRFLGCCDTANGLELSGNVRFICPVYSPRLQFLSILIVAVLCVADGILFIHLPTVFEYTVYQIHRTP